MKKLMSRVGQCELRENMVDVGVDLLNRSGKAVKGVYRGTPKAPRNAHPTYEPPPRAVPSETRAKTDKPETPLHRGGFLGKMSFADQAHYDKLDIARKRKKDTEFRWKKTQDESKAVKAVDAKKAHKGSFGALGNVLIGAPAAAFMYAGGGSNEESATVRAGNLQEGGDEDEVEMPKKVYKKEHQHLLKVLKKCKTAAAKQEARKQSKEMKRELRKKDD